MTYLEKIKNDYENRIISFQKLKTMEENYKSSNEKEKIELRYEKDLEIKNYHNDVRVIRKNVQYFFWVSIISIISTIIFLLF